MSLVSGPGRGGGHGIKDLPDELTLVVEKHVEYIRKLDTVRRNVSSPGRRQLSIVAET